MGGADVPPPPADAVGMGAGAEPQVRPALPVAHVVDASVAWQRPVRHLVVFVSRLAEHHARGVVHLRLRVGIGSGERAGPDPASELRGRLDGQRVAGEVLGSPLDGFDERSLPCVERLPVGAVDEIQVHIVEAGTAGRPEGEARGLRRVDPLECLEHGRIEGLDPDRQPGDAAFAEDLEIGLIDRVRIRLDGDLGVTLDREGRTEALEERQQDRCRQGGGRASPEEDRAEPEASPRRRGQLGFASEGLDVRIRQVIESGVGVEVAVPATRQTERDVDVEAGSARRHRRSPTTSRSTFSAAMNASCGTSTRPTLRMRAFPAFCFSRSFRFRVMSPP